MIILDPHSSHQSLDLLKLAKANDIHSLALPLHTTNWLSPLDKTLFGLSKKNIREYNVHVAVSRKYGVQVGKVNAIPTCTQYGIKPKNIVKGFESCGIYPVTGIKYLHLRLLLLNHSILSKSTRPVTQHICY